MNSTVIEVSWQKGEYKTGPTNYSVSAIDAKNNASKYSCSTEGKPNEPTPVLVGFLFLNFQFSVNFILYIIDGPFVLFHLVIVLFDLRFVASDYHLNIFKLFLH